MKEIKQTYFKLLKLYGHQGWWPLLSLHSTSGVNPTKSGSINGYHPRDYSYPKTNLEKFEICIGAILTQNTSWPNVEKALINLNKLNAIDPYKLLSLDEEQLKIAIKPSGYYNQKCKKLIEFCKFYISKNGETPSRKELLLIWGIGPETADSILLYAYKVPSFVVDNYTKRIFDLNDKKYDEIKELFEKSLPRDYVIYQEYHALIVEHAKQIK